MPESVRLAAVGAAERIADLSAGHWIDGRATWLESDGTFDIEDPSAERTLCSLPDASADAVLRAVSAAAAAGPGWEGLGGRGRADVLERLAALLDKSVAWLAELETMTTGRPIREMLAQLRVVPEWYRYFAAMARTEEGSVPPFAGHYLNYVERRPLGVIAQITPWNHPLLILTKKVAPALAAGNTVVVKPSEFAPLTALAVARLATEAGLPDGVMNVLLGLGATAGAKLTLQPGIAKFDLTGGTETGRRLGAIAGERLARFSAELGGKAPVIVFADMDPRTAAHAAAVAAFIASGQTCVQGARILVERPLLRAFTEALVERAQTLRLGDPRDVRTQMGPLVSARQRQRVESYIEIAREEGGTVVTGGVKPQSLPVGYYLEPTVIANVDPMSRVAQEEIFGPVSCILPFDGEEEAIALGNGTSAGLAASIWTRDLARAHRVAQSLQCGVVWVNDHHRIDPSSPWGGFKESGVGRENGREAWREYTQTHSVIVNLDDPAPDWYDSEEVIRLS